MPTTAPYFVDTNLLIYAFDRSEPVKQKMAQSVLRHLQAGDLGVISTQVLAEFYSTATRKLSASLTSEQALQLAEDFASAWPVLSLTQMIVLEALRGVRQHHFSYWDAQVWAVARMNQVPTVLSEDFTSGRTIEGVFFLNPLTPDFDLTDLSP